MMKQRQVFASLLLGGAVVFVLGLGALAQSVSLTVTAYSDAVRFSAQGSVKELRVEMLSLSGQKVFDSGPVLGNALDWKLSNTQGQPVANGVYLYTVTVKDPSGNVTKKLGKLAVLRGKGGAAPPLSGITVGQLAEPRLQPQQQTFTDVIVTGSLTVGASALGPYRLDVRDDTDASLNQTVLRVSRQHPVSGLNVQTFFQVENYGNNAVAGSHMRLAFARGGREGPAAVLPGDRLGSLIYSGWDGVMFQNPAAVFAYVAGPVSPGSVPARLAFETGACFSGCDNPRQPRMVILDNGNVGIGTTNPTYRVSIQATGNDNYLSMSENQPGGADGFEFQIAPGGGSPTTRIGYFRGNFGAANVGFYILNARNAPLRFGTNDTERMRIDSNGNVGIGTTSPGEKLTVAGVIHSTTGGFRFPDGTIQTTAATGAAGWSLTGNAGTNPATNFLGTTDNAALEIRVNNARALRIEPATSAIECPGAICPNIIGGFSGNSVGAGVVGATIGGGGTSLGTNRVTAAFGTVGGGKNNTASGGGATVGGGADNTASGTLATVGGGGNNIASGVGATVGGGGSNTASGGHATVGGGRENTASGALATVGGGVRNTASGLYATVGGGADNTASGGWATVGGGGANTAAGDYSFVVGRRAKNTDPNHDGVFLFADSNDFDFFSTAANQFRVRATGGAQFVLGIDASGNPTWTCSVSNGTSWACSSDRNLKENLTLVDGRQVLAQLSALPIYTWSAKGGDPAVRHMGPMAQDFYSIFRLGTDDKTISTIDLDGVALVSIQALYQMSLALEQKDKELEAKVKEIDELRQRIEKLEKLVQELSAKK
jgi:hypothetical protein